MPEGEEEPIATSSEMGEGRNSGTGALMAKFTFTSPPAPSQVQSGTMLRTQSNGMTVMQQANNNFNGPSVKFTELNRLILALDARFSLLQNQADWETLAAAVDGLWDLCANCDPDADAQRLYRQINFNRSLIGLPREDDPTLFAAFVAGVTYTLVTTPTFVSLTLAAGQSAATWLIVQQGNALGNELILTAPGFGTPYANGTKSNTFLRGLPAGSSWKVCTFSVDGMPGLSTNLDVP